MGIGDKIKVLRLQLGLTLEQVGDAVGVGKSTVRKWENGLIANMRRDKIASLAKVLHTTPAYLMGWTTDPSDTADQTVSTPASRPNGLRIPILGEVRAGMPSTIDENILGYEEIYPTDPSPERYVFLRVKGDSMLPRIEEGDLALIDTQAEVHTGDLAVVIVNGDESTIKKVVIDKDGITIHAYNPYYPDVHYTPQEVEQLPVRVFGRVLEIRSKY